MMKNLLFTMSFLCLSAIAYASDCVPNQSLVQFTSLGKPVQSNLIGTLGVCEDFGGNQVKTPKNQVTVYVNFNIKGTINLDQIDEAMNSGLRFQTASEKQRLSTMTIVVVRDGWIKEAYSIDEDVATNLVGSIVFISQKILESGKFEEAITLIYSSNKNSQSI